MKVSKTFTVEQRGIGKPDYTREVSAGRERPGLYLKYNQQLRLFGYNPTDVVAHPYAIPWVKPVLAAGVTAHLIDFSTGVPMPYLLERGYIATFIEITWSFNQDCEFGLYFDTLLISSPGITSGGQPQHFSKIIAYSSSLLDPTAGSSHLTDLVLINHGLADMRGGLEAAVIIEAIGTPPFPDTKTCMCPFCSHLQKVKVGTTEIICDNCHATYHVMDLSKVRQT